MKKLIISIINLYHNYFSPNMIRCCRFYPSCSQYSIEAIRKYGLGHGLIRGALRILRCNPLSKGGHDPA